MNTHAASTDALTKREREILTLIAEGNSLSEIASQLSRSLKTIESHRLSIGRKLNASNRVELTHIAIANGLVSIQPDPASTDIAAPTSSDAELRMLRVITQAVDNRTGYEYIKVLCKTLCEVLDVHICGICVSADEVSDDERFAIAMCHNLKMESSFYYSLKGSPVAQAYADGRIHVLDRLAEAYPEVPFYKEYGLRSYIGLRLGGDYGAETGVFAIAHEKPFDTPELIERTMLFFKDRIAAELTVLFQGKQIESLKQEIKDKDKSAV